MNKKIEESKRVSKSRENFWKERKRLHAKAELRILESYFTLMESRTLLEEKDGKEENALMWRINQEIERLKKVLETELKAQG